MKKFVLVWLLLLAMPLAYAATPQYVVNVTTNDNGSITLVDELGHVGGPYVCSSGQRIEFRGSTKYDATVSDCMGQLSNLSCSVKEVSCGIPTEQITSIRNDIANNPKNIIEYLNQTGLFKSAQDYEKCAIDLNSTKVTLSNTLQQKGQEISDLDSRNNIYLGIIIFIAALFGIVVVILIAGKMGVGDKLRGQDMGFRQIPKQPPQNGGQANGGQLRGLPPFPR